MTQENEKLISGEETQPEQQTPGGNSRIIDDPFIDQFYPGGAEQVANKDIVKNGAVIQESFGANSTFEINLQTGKMFYNQHLYSTEGNHLPAGFSIAYNDRFASQASTYDGKAILCKGWKLNYQQFIRFVDNKCVYVDGAFKEHIFEKSTFNESVYLDVSTQSGALLRPANTDEQSFADYVMFDDANTQLFFKDSRLVKIRQNNGSTPTETNITHDGLNRVIQVVDGIGKTYSIGYLSNSVTITVENNEVLATLTINNSNQLSSISYLDGKVCSFQYSNASSSLLTSVEDQSALEKLTIGRDNNSKIASLTKATGNSNVPVSNVFFHYSPSKSCTIVSKNVIPDNQETITDWSQIRYKYSFDADGVLLDAHEIDQDDQPIGLQPYRPEVEDEANNPIYDIKNKKDLLNGVAVDCPAHSMEGSAMQILNADLIVPSYKGSAYLFLSWDLDINTGEAISPTGTIVCEAFANGRSIGGVLCDCANDTSYSGFCVAKELIPNTTTTVTLKMTHTGNTFPITLSNVRAWFAPVTRNEVRINITPSSVAGIDPVCIPETLGSVQQYWFPIGQVPFDTNHGRVVPQTFTVADYQKTMLSYFKSPTNFNLFYNDCKNVVYGVSSLTVEKMAQTLYFEDLPFAVVQTSMTGQTTITHFTPENSKLNIHTRPLNDPLDCAYTKLDNYLRTTSEWTSGSAMTTYDYDTYGNVKESYFGGSTGIRDTSTFSANGQQVIQSPDYRYADAHTTTFAYNPDGMLSGITTPLDATTSFEYKDRSVLKKVSNSVDQAVNTIDSNGVFISSLEHNGATFQFVYDDRNNISEVKVSGATLLGKTVTHSSNGGYFTESTYANQQVIRKYYDKYDRLIKISDATSSESELAKFIYSDEEVATDVTEPTDGRLVISGSSKLRVVIDITTNTRTNYSYDGFGRLNQVHSRDIDTNQTNINTTQTKDEHDRVESVSQALSSGNTVTTQYTHATFPDNTLLAETTQLTGTTALSTTYSIDNLQRPTTTKVMCGANGHKYTYGYIPRQTKTWVPTSGGGLGPIIRPGSVGDGVASPYALDGYWQFTDVGTTPYVSKFEEYTMSGNTATLVRTDSIVYDANGNITKYGNATYQYDGLNRLVRENNPGIDKTTIWHYNTSGNITSKSEFAYTTSASPTGGTTTAFIYGTSWKDQLSVISVGTTSKAITYDQAGNPTTYKGATLSWTRGRLLASYKVSNAVGSTLMTYDANGIRKTKFVPTASHSNTHTYYYDGNNLVCEKIVWANSSQTSTTIRTYLYNSQGIVGFVDGGNTYTFRKNLFGDIVAIYQGATKVAEYAYDAWGNCTIVSDTNYIGRNNPFRYRGYYWDNDLQLYYLMSRYYDPQIGRFINADTLDYLDPESINGLNLYAYCYNNPIMFADPSGHDPFLVITLLVVSFVVGAGASAISQGVKYGWDNISVAQVGIDGLISLFSTALSMTGISMVGSILVGGAIGLGQYAIESNLHDVPTTWEGFISAFITGAVGGALSGAGARNRANVLANRQLTGKGASAFKAIATAGERFRSGKISIKGFSATTRLWGKVLNDALLDATETTIRKLTINGASIINAWTVSNALATCIIHLFK